MRLGIIRLYCGKSGQKGFYNMQEIGEAKAYSRQGVDVYIIFLDTSITQINEQKEADKITILRVPARSIMNHGFFDCSVLLKYQIDMIQLQSDNQMYAPHVINYCRRHNIGCYSYIGTLYSDSDNWLKRSLMNLFSIRNIRYYKRMVTFCKNSMVQEQLRRKNVPDCVLAPVGLDLDLIPVIEEKKAVIRQNLKIPQNKKVLLFVGRLESYKHPQDAIELMEQLDESYFLIMIGDGHLKEEVRSKASSIGAADRIRFIDKIPNSEIHYYYKASDIYINLNEKEIFGMSLLEAMYNGCTVVAIEAPGPEMIIKDGVSGYLAKDLREMRKIICGKSILASREVMKRVVDCYTWEKTVDIFIKQMKLYIE